MTINSSINKLLFTNEAVILPSLGTLVASNVGAKIDFQRGIIMPPHKEIVFNPAIDHNDAMLANEMAKALNLTLSEAINLVGEEISKMKDELRKTGRVAIEGVGTLHMLGASITFVQDMSVNFNTESYGFEKLSVRPITPKASVKLESGSQIRKIAATAAILLSLLTAPQATDGPDANRQHAGIIAPISLIDCATGATTETEKVEAEPTTQYYIIVASFKSEAEADDYIERMQKRGVSELMKLKNGKKVRVAAARFTDYEEAKRANTSIRQMDGFAKSWILQE